MAASKLIPKEDLTTLKPASELLSVSEVAELENLKNALAFRLNTDANAGLTESVWNQELPEEVQEELTGMGYTITESNPDSNKSMVYPYTISWRKESDA